jgi:hypothetical protein
MNILRFVSNVCVAYIRKLSNPQLHNVVFEAFLNIVAPSDFDHLRSSENKARPSVTDGVSVFLRVCLTPYSFHLPYLE